MTGPKLMGSSLPPGVAKASIWLHGYPATLYHQGAVPEGLPDRGDALRWLAERHGCVGDFVCGYGGTGLVFARAGKRFILSDHNPDCIRHIAARAPGWR